MITVKALLESFDYFFDIIDCIALVECTSEAGRKKPAEETSILRLTKDTTSYFVKHYHNFIATYGNNEVISFRVVKHINKIYIRIKLNEDSTPQIEKD